MTMQATVLLVDDERSICSALKRTFRQHRFTVHAANSGQEALDILDNNEIDVIVSDQRMPGMTGTELLSIVRQQYPRIGRIILSGQSDEKDLIQAINEAKVKHFVSKPWNEDELLNIVESAIPLQTHSNSGTRLLPIQTVSHPSKNRKDKIIPLERALNKKQVKFEHAIKQDNLELQTQFFKRTKNDLEVLKQAHIHWPEFGRLPHLGLTNLADQAGYLQELFTWYLISLIDQKGEHIGNNEITLVDLFTPYFLISQSQTQLLEAILSKDKNYTLLIPYEYLVQKGIYEFFDIVKHHGQSIALNIANRVIDIPNLDISCIDYIAMDGKIASLSNHLLTEKRLKMMAEIKEWNYQSLLLNTQEVCQQDYANKMGFDYY
jgi:CheY-like chemotaxis protein